MTISKRSSLLTPTEVDDLPGYSCDHAKIAADLSVVPKHCVSKFTAASRGFSATVRVSCSTLPVQRPSTRENNEPWNTI